MIDERKGLWSASSAERVHYCPGSVALIKSIPADQREQAPDEARDSGTRIHAALEADDGSGLEMSETEIKERLEKMRAEAVDQWGAQMREQFPDKAAQLKTEDHKFAKEERLWIWDAELNNITSAKLDYFCFAGDFGLVCDYKTGYLETTAAQRNFQAKVQAVALWQTHGVKHIRVVIAQHRFRSMLTQADYDEEALQRAYFEILQDDWRSKQPDAPRVPGPHCDYCDAKAHCHEAGIYSLMAVKVAAPVLQYVAKKAEVELAVSQLTPEQLAYIEHRRGISEKIFEAVKQRLKKLPADQLRQLGFELNDGRAQMEVKDSGAVIAWAESEKLIQEDEIMDVYDLAHGRLEELILPRIVANPAYGVTNQKDAKAFLRSKLSGSGWVDYTSSRTEGSLKSL